MEGKCGRGKKCRFPHPEGGDPTAIKPKPPVVAQSATPKAPKAKKKVAKVAAPVAAESSESSASDSSDSSDSSDDEDDTPMPQAAATIAAVPVAVAQPAATTTKPNPVPVAVVKPAAAANPKTVNPKTVTAAPAAAAATAAAAAPASTEGTPARTRPDGKDPKEPKAKRRKVDKKTTAEGAENRGGHLATVLEMVRICEANEQFKEAYKEVFNKSRVKGWSSTSGMGSIGGSGCAIFGLDCEMVHAEGDTAALGRVTLVNLNPSLPSDTRASVNVVMDRIVSPPGRVVLDYRTQISGLKKEDFEQPTCLKSVEEAQAMMRACVPANAILVGHSMNNDLQALRLIHKTVIDTVYLFKSPLKHQLIGLKDLVSMKFGATIQPAGQAHDSKEDAAWTLELVRQTIDKLDASAPTTRKERNERLVTALTVELPVHYKQRLQIFQLPEGATIDNISAALNIPAGAKKSARSIQYRSKKKGDKPLGSTIIMMDDPEITKAIFQAIPCDGMKTDKDDIYQKKVWLNKAQHPTLRHFWLKAYHDPGSLVTATPAAVLATPPALSSPSAPATPSLLGAGPGSDAATPASASRPQFCGQCGTKVEAGWKFCMSCGGKLA